MAKLRITWTKSAIGHKRYHKEGIRSLGFRNLGQTIEREDSPTLRGILTSIRHLVTVEELK